MTSVKIDVFPNPSTGLVNLDIETLTASIVKVSILDINGQQVLSNKYATQSGENSFKINLGDVNPGVYYFNITNENDISIKAGKLAIIR